MAATNEEASLRQRSGAVRLTSLWIFLATSLVASWTIWLWPVEKQASFYLIVHGWRINLPLAFARLLLGNCVPGVLALLWSFGEGREQLRSMLSTLFFWRASPKWYLFSLALPSVLFWVSAEIVFLRYPSERAWPSLLHMGLVWVLTLPFGPIWEELAWRAYTLRRLESRFTPLLSALLLGVFWGAWHIPLWLDTLALSANMKIPVLLVAGANVVGWSVIFTFIYDGSRRSLPVVILMHATYAAVSTGISSVLARGDFLFIVISSALSIVVALFLGAHLRSKRLAGDAG